jgi:hypothetical protein
MPLSPRTRPLCCLLACIGWTLTTSIASAQSEERPSIEPGTAVTLTTVRGARVKGKVSTLNSDALMLVSVDKTLRVAFDDVQRIERRRHRRVIGAVIGAAASFAAVCLPYTCKSHAGTDDPGLAEILGVVSTTGGALIGAGAGASIDALRSGRTLYDRQAIRDDLSDGAAKGAFVGLVGGMALAFADGCGHYTTCQIGHVEAIVKGGFGMLGGAGIGALIDRAANHGRGASATRRASTIVTVAPVFFQSARGGLVSIRW